MLTIRDLGERLPDVPERGEEAALREAREHRDGRPLRADRTAADHALDHLDVHVAPDRGPLVELDQRLGEVVQVGLLEGLHVGVGEGEARCGPGLLERGPEPRRTGAELAEARGVEAAAVTERLAHLVVLPGREPLEHVQGLGDDHDAVVGAAEQPQRAADLVLAEQHDRLVDLEAGELSQSSDDWCAVWKGGLIQLEKLAIKCKTVPQNAPGQLLTHLALA